MRTPWASSFLLLAHDLPFGIARAVELPVPPELLAEAGLALTHPVLQPHGGQRRAFFAKLLDELLDPLGSALNAHDRTLMHPLRKRPHAARVLGVFANQIRRTPPV